MSNRQELGHGKGCGFHSNSHGNHWRGGEEGRVIPVIIFERSYWMLQGEWQMRWSSDSVPFCLAGGRREGFTLLPRSVLNT